MSKGYFNKNLEHSIASLEGRYSGAKKHQSKIKDTRPVFIKEPYGLPRELQPTGKFRDTLREKISTKKTYVKTDAWRGYYTFPNSVYDTWATGEWSDAGENAGSKVKERIAKIRKALKEQGIASKVKATQTSNTFSTGVDVLVAPSNVERAKKIVESGGFE